MHTNEFLTELSLVPVTEIATPNVYSVHTRESPCVASEQYIIDTALSAVTWSIDALFSNINSK